MAYAASVEKTVPVSRHKVYQLVADFGGIGKLFPAIESVDCKSNSVGSVRKVRLKDVPGELWERLECLVEDKFVSYSIINEVPLPLERYHAMVDLSDAPNGGCKIRWVSNWVAKGAPEAEVKTLVEGLYTTFIENIAKA